MKQIAQFFLVGLVLLAIVVVYDGFFILEEGKQVVITQFGAPVGEPVTDAGLHFSQGPAKILSKDPLSGKIVQCANTLIAKINSDLNYVPKRLI